jgi:adhesin HecA-like repeat protein
VQAGRNLDLTLDGHLDNAAGAIAAGQRLTLTAASVDNRNTRGGDGTRGLQASCSSVHSGWTTARARSSPMAVRGCRSTASCRTPAA